MKAQAAQTAPALLTKPAQCAKALSISQRTLGNLVLRRIIPSIKIRRLRLFDMVKVKAALEKFEQIELTR
jgi:hypothetical protein